MTHTFLWDYQVILTVFPTLFKLWTRDYFCEGNNVYKGIYIIYTYMLLNKLQILFNLFSTNSKVSSVELPERSLLLGAKVYNITQSEQESGECCVYQ